MEQLFVGNAVILLLWVYISFVIQVKERYKKILLMYLVTYIANVFDVVATIPSYLILLFALFFELEFWEDTFKRKIINNVFEKMADFAYIMIFQYALISYTIALFISSTWFVNMIENRIARVAAIVAGVFAVYFSCKSVSSEKYKVCSFGRMKQKIDSIKKYRDFLREEIFIYAPECVISIEDRSFYSRGEKYTFFNLYYLQKRYLRKLVGFMKRFIVSRNKKSSVKKFLRGYSTIEMQLLRTLAIEDGYTCIFRRKIYEILYARLFLKNLKKYYKECDCEVDLFKDYLLYLYLRLAPCLNKGREKHFETVVGERKDVENFSGEELFVLTLCFSGKVKRENVLDIYSDIIEEQELDMDELERIVSELNAE